MSPTPLRPLAGSVVALFGLVTLGVAGCFPREGGLDLATPDRGGIDWIADDEIADSTSGGGIDSTGGGPIDTTNAGDSVAVARAFFLLHGVDIRSAAWPDAYRAYSLFVCDPSLSSTEVTKVRRDVPGARLLAYADLQDIWLGFYSANPYYAAMEAAFDTSLCVIDLSSGTVVRMYGATDAPGSGVPHYVLMERSVEILVAFHRDVTMAAGFDGIYLDQCTLHYPQWRRDLLLAQTTAFDSDADGAPDRIEDLEAQYDVWRPEFTRRLREALGDSRILLGNSGGALGDPELQGITLEGVGDRFSPEEARSCLAQQKALSRSPFLGILWATTPPSEAPSWSLAAELGVYYGVIDPAD